jgi:ATP-dependent Clp protease ATP-binding subunit ClpC
VLLDEIEKAHPDVFNILLQVLDEGRLTDNYGRVIDFKNTVLIMTSNLGARDITKGKAMGFHQRDKESAYETMRERVREEIERAFNPEFLNRVDDIIVFHPLTREQIGEIVHIMLKDVHDRLADGCCAQLPGGPRLRREVRRPSAAPCDSALHRGSVVGEDSRIRVPGWRRD